jgi:hypothetical protein
MAEMDPLARKAHADLIVARAAQQLRDVLKAAVAAVDPFPPYPGSFFSYGIEVEPPAGAGSGLGCVVVGQDGELYELIMRIDLSGDPSDPVGMRDEEMRKLDLAPAAYIPLAQAAVDAVTAYLLEKTEGPGYSAT